MPDAAVSNLQAENKLFLLHNGMFGAATHTHGDMVF